MIAPHFPFPGVGKILKEKSLNRFTYEPLFETLDIVR